MNASVRMLSIAVILVTGLATVGIRAEANSGDLHNKANIIHITLNHATALAETEYTVNGVTHRVTLATQEVPIATATNPNKVSGVEEYILFLVDQVEIDGAPYKTVWKSYWKRLSGVPPTAKLWSSINWDSSNSKLYLTVVESAGTATYNVRVYSIDSTVALDSYPYDIDLDDTSWAHEAKAVAEEDDLFSMAGNLSALTTIITGNIIHISTSCLKDANRPCFKLDYDLASGKWTRSK